MDKFEIIFYEKVDGIQPVVDFILNQNIKMRAKILKSIELLEEKGNYLRAPYSKHLDDGIFELRIKQASDITRVLYFFVLDKKIVMTNAFVKKTQKTPKSEIELAKRRRLMFIEREGL